MRVVSTPGHTVGHQSVLVEMDEGTATMVGDAAFTAGIYHDMDKGDLSSWPGQHTDREEWTKSLNKLHGLRPRAVHFCHDTHVVTGA